MPLHCAIVIHAVDGLGSISTKQGQLQAHQYTTQVARGRARGMVDKNLQDKNISDSNYKRTQNRTQTSIERY